MKAKVPVIIYRITHIVIFVTLLGILLMGIFACIYGGRINQVMMADPVQSCGASLLVIVGLIAAWELAYGFLTRLSGGTYSRYPPRPIPSKGVQAVAQRMASDHKYKQMICENPEEALKEYDLAPEESRAVQVFASRNPETDIEYMFDATFGKDNTRFMKYAASIMSVAIFFKEYPDAIICPKCQGNGSKHAVRSTFLGTLVDTSICHVCNGKGFVPNTLPHSRS